MIAAMELVTRLVGIADTMVDGRDTQISDIAIRTLRDEVLRGSRQLSESEFTVDYQSICLIECIAELAYARSENDTARQERATMYINTLRTFLRIDCERASRKRPFVTGAQ